MFPCFKARKHHEPEDETFKRNKRRLMEKTKHLLCGISTNPSCFLFSNEELNEATNNYDPKQVFLDDGSFRLYKGFLHGQQVIVKKFTNKNGLESSLIDIIISKEMNGHNAIKLVGVCLDTEIPIPVFEFFKYSNGTLGDRMGNKSPGFEPIPWKHRVNIAFHLACTIAYFRLQLPRFVVHGGLKPSTILLDEHNVPVLTDFSSSKVISQKVGTDKKNDVYSIGLLILALLTGKEVCDSPPIEKSSKEYYLMDHVKESTMSERLKEIMLDPIILVGRPLTTEKANELRDFIVLALECICDLQLERPRISDVVNRLGDIELSALKNKHC